MVTRIGTDRGETLRGTNGSDLLDGRGGNDQILGLGGDDRLAGGLGANRIDGGPGRDTVAFGLDPDDGPFGPAGDADIDLARGTFSFDGGPVTRLVGIEGATGGLGDDTLAGNGGANLLSGRDGDDTILGRGGGDELSGGGGIDRIAGGGGDDTIFFAGTGEARGNAGDDTLNITSDDVEAGIFGGPGADRFEIGFIRLSDADIPLLFTISDFDTRSGDVIALPEFDDAPPYEFVGTGPLTAADGVLAVRVDERGGDTFVQYEVQDDPEFGQELNEIRVAGRLGLTVDDLDLG